MKCSKCGKETNRVWSWDNKCPDCTMDELRKEMEMEKEKKWLKS